MLLDSKFPHIILIWIDRQKISADLSKSIQSRETFHIFSGSERVLTPIAALMQLSDLPRQQINKYGCTPRSLLVLSFARGMVLGGEEEGGNLPNPLNIPT